MSNNNPTIEYNYYKLILFHRNLYINCPPTTSGINDAENKVCRPARSVGKKIVNT